MCPEVWPLGWRWLQSDASVWVLWSSVWFKESIHPINNKTPTYTQISIKESEILFVLLIEHVKNGDMSFLETLSQLLWFMHRPRCPLFLLYLLSAEEIVPNTVCIAKYLYG